MTMAVSRRVFLSGVAAAATAPMLPAVPAAADVTIIGVDMASGPDIMMWAIGTPGEYDWRPIAANTAEEAFKEFCHMWGIGPEDSGLYSLNECVERVKAWDGKNPDEIKPADWIRADMGAFCHRCDSECYGPDGARAFGDEVVCEECITIADLVDDDPEDAIERLADQIADLGEEDARAWAIAEGAEVPDGMWATALARAAT